MDVTRIRSTPLLTGMFLLPALLSGCLMNESTEPASLQAPGPVVNTPPTIGGTPPRVVKVGVTYLFAPSAADVDGDELEFLIENQPGWLEFDPENGSLSGVPFLGSEGSYNDIVITADDGSATTSLPAFTITVEPETAANMPPEISGTPPTTVVAGNTYSFTPSASDPDGDSLAFNLVGNPIWLTIDAMTGVVTGSPQDTDVGTYPDIAVSVNDGVLSSSLPAFAITVAPATASNLPPEISGTPPTSVTVGSDYSFEPSASDPNGDTLAFEIQGNPEWLTIDAESGIVSGAPQSTDVGTYPDIIVSVNDGELSASLPAFTIEVTEQAVMGSVTLSWTPPTQNTDGSPLEDLDGYRIYYSTTAGDYPDPPIIIDNPGLTSYVVENLAAGTYYFVSTAVNLQGIESDHSNMATKTVTP